MARAMCRGRSLPDAALSSHMILEEKTTKTRALHERIRKDHEKKEPIEEEEDKHHCTYTVLREDITR